MHDIFGGDISHSEERSFLARALKVFLGADVSSTTDPVIASAHGIITARQVNDFFIGNLLKMPLPGDSCVVTPEDNAIAHYSNVTNLPTIYNAASGVYQAYKNSSVISGGQSYVNPTTPTGNWTAPPYTTQSGKKLHFIKPCAGPITSPYGYRIHPITGARKMHTGIDIGAGYNTPIKASEGGKVVYLTTEPGYGKVFVIYHGIIKAQNGKASGRIETLYAHCSKINVSIGQSVEKGQVVATVGSTGMSTGPHLHFEVRINNKHQQPMDFINRTYEAR